MSKASITKQSRAFSLIELSIVILIIGIIIAGITSGSRVIVQAKLSSARTQTQSSPVASIKNLVGWWEATSEASFVSSETENSSTITTWYDLNPQFSIKANATAPGAGLLAKPTYKSICINNLPCVSFNGSTQGMSTSQLPTSSIELTYFIVFSANDTSSAQALVYTNMDWPTDGLVHYSISGGGISYGLKPNGTSINIYGGAVATTKAAYLGSVIDTGATQTTFFNGILQSSVSNNTIIGSGKSLSAGITFGYWNVAIPQRYLNGYIGEIIIYDRGLKTDERQAVEKYLGRKWGINIS